MKLNILWGNLTTIVYTSACVLALLKGSPKLISALGSLDLE